MKWLVISMALMALPSTAHAESGTLTANLDGPSVTYTGDADGEGTLTATLDTDNGLFCYMLQTSNIEQAIAAHIHEGGAGSPGRPMIDLVANQQTCVNVGLRVLEDIRENPGDYYVDVLTADFPRGSIRGQLAED